MTKKAGLWAFYIIWPGNGLGLSYSCHSQHWAH